MMLPDLGPYAGDVIAAYGVGLAILVGLISMTWWQARRAKAKLDALEGR
ncbi:MAG: heme exporter protein CcmD [Pseudomonadota bacterium]